MPELIDGLVLYHGSYCEVEMPDLRKCAAYKDFGKGFYLTSSQKQAEEFVRISIRKARKMGTIDGKQNYGMVSTFRFQMHQKLAVHIFQEADAKWLHCIAGHRKVKVFSDSVKSLEGFDIVAGKIANDATNFTLTTYMSGAYGELGSKEADEDCIKRLLPERLQDQYCFRTNAALECLTFVGSERIWV